MSKKVIKLRYPTMRNETHVEFHSDATTVVGKYPVSEMGLAGLFDKYKQTYTNETGLLKLIRKSSLTGDLVGVDEQRDSLFRGFVDSVKGGTKHFDPVHSAAAVKIQALLDHFGNIASRNIDDATAALDALLSELSEGEYPAYLATLQLSDWVTNLRTANDNFKNLKQQRYAEQATRPTTNMRTARSETDKAYRELVTMIDAQTLNPDNTRIPELVNELNAVVKRFKEILERGGERQKEEEVEKEDEEKKAEGKTE